MSGGMWPPRGPDAVPPRGPDAAPARGPEPDGQSLRALPDAGSLQRARAGLEGFASRFSTSTRGLLLPVFTWPLLPDVIVEVIRGKPMGLAAALVGLLLPILAMRKLRRGRKGDTRRAAVLVAVATGIVAGLGAKMPMPIPILLAGMAWLGTRLLYDGAVQEVAPAPEPAPPMPPGPLEEAELRLARIAARRDARFDPVLAEMRILLTDLAARPERLPLARRFLAVHLDGLERIVDRLRAGAEPPPGMTQLLADLETAARELGSKLRAEESAALDIQVKVLSERLRQEGYA